MLFRSAERDAEGVTSRFLEAVAAGDVAAACGLLTPRARDEVAVSEGSLCTESLPAERLAQELAGRAVTGVDVWSGWAKASTGSGALFLTEFDSGWLISAAGCTPHGDEPYRCVVGG